MKRWWRDTLARRLFLLMWAALLGSQLLGLWVARGLGQPPAGPPDERRADHPPGLAPGPRAGPHTGPLPGLHAGPPPDPHAGLAPELTAPPPPGLRPGPPQPPARTVWIDYLVRALVIGAAAWWGARWVAGPMRRLGAAASALSAALARGQAPGRLDELHGSEEVRDTARVFNEMSVRLHEQFAQRSLVMSAISHDLRTPLTRLRLRLEHLRADPQAARCVADVQEVDALIGAMLDVLHEERATAPAETVDLQALAQALADDAAEQGLQVSVSSSRGGVGGSSAPALAFAQPVALRRVLGNLLANARCHAPGPVEIAIEALAPGEVGPSRDGGPADAALPRAWVRVAVRDRGPGIPADRLEAVFQPFFRLDPARSRAGAGPGQGIGLGLYIARELMQRQGGRVELRPRQGGGLSAEIVLPAAAPR